MDDVWSGAISAPAPASTGSAVSDFFGSLVGLASAKVDQEAQRARNQEQFAGDKTVPRFGVAEGGRPFFVGAPTFAGTSIAGVPAPLVLVGVGILAVAFVFLGKR